MPEGAGPVLCRRPISRYGIPKSKPLKYARAAAAALRMVPAYLRNGDGAATSCMNVLIAARRLGITLRYALTFGRFPNYLNPSSMSEKMQWRKAFDRNPVLPTLCDKLAVREYAAARVPGLRFPTLHWSGTSPEEMPLDSLPLPFVVKPNNRSGANIFVRRPEDLDRDRIVRQCREWLAAPPYGRRFGEWAYSRVPSKLLIEEFLPDGALLGSPPNHDIFVFNGRAGFIFFSTGRYSSRAPQRCLLTADWETIPVDRWRARGFVVMDGNVPKPKNLDFMVEAAKKIAAEVDFLRVDLYNLDGSVYLSEVSPYPYSGLTMWIPKGADISGRPPREVDDCFGAFWELPPIPYWTRIRRGLLG